MSRLERDTLVAVYDHEGNLRLGVVSETTEPGDEMVSFELVGSDESVREEIREVRRLGI